MFDVDAEEQLEADLARLGAEYRRANEALKRARSELVAKIVYAADIGMKQSRIVRASGYTREHIRRLVRDAGDGEAGE